MVLAAIALIVSIVLPIYLSMMVQQQQQRLDSAIADLNSRVSKLEGQTPEAYLNNLYAAAKQEGALTFYHFYPTEWGQAMLNAFQAKYPGISLSQFTAPAGELVTRISSEATAGKYTADVINMDAASHGVLKSMNLTAPYKALGAQGGTFDPAFIDPDYNYYVVILEVMGGVVNTKLVPKELWPIDWTDYINPNPKLKGLVSFGDARRLGTQYIVLFSLITKYGQEKTKTMYQSLTSINAKMWPTGSTGTDWVTTGEAPIIFALPHTDYEGLRAAGVPVEFLSYASGLPAVAETMGIARNAPHPNAAKLFIEFYLSEEGQVALTKEPLWFVPTRRGLVAQLPFLPPVSELLSKVIIIDYLAAANQRTDLRNLWGQWLGLA
ncbi:MAG: extracellular solute-binding protein [Candidatus Bathyarchaeia archaeon]